MISCKFMISCKLWFHATDMISCKIWFHASDMISCKLWFHVNVMISCKQCSICRGGWGFLVPLNPPSLYWPPKIVKISQKYIADPLLVFKQIMHASYDFMQVIYNQLWFSCKSCKSHDLMQVMISCKSYDFMQVLWFHSSYDFMQVMISCKSYTISYDFMQVMQVSWFNASYDFMQVIWFHASVMISFKLWFHASYDFMQVIYNQ